MMQLLPIALVTVALIAVQAVAATPAAVASTSLCESAALSELDPAEHRRSLEAFRRVLDKDFRDPTRSPLPVAELENFSGLSFYPIDPALLRPAAFRAASGDRRYDLPTFNGEIQHYREYGELEFCGPDGSISRLKLFQRQDRGELGRMTVLAPFRDSSNGRSSYSGGRYLKFLLPLEEPLQIDFNRAVNPGCAYNPTLPCPIPPRANWLPYPVNGGERDYVPAGTAAPVTSQAPGSP